MRKQELPVKVSSNTGRAPCGVFSRALGVVRGLYDWVLSLADRRYAAALLFLIAFAESSFFPVPPDVLLIALALGAPGRALGFAAICTAGSVAGGALGYALGLYVYELVGRPIIEIYGAQSAYLEVRTLYRDWDAVAIFVAGFTPLPYKVFTIAAGAFRIDFPTFLLVSAVSRGARFLLVGALIFRFGPRGQAVHRPLLQLAHRGLCGPPDRWIPAPEICYLLAFLLPRGVAQFGSAHGSGP